MGFCASIYMLSLDISEKNMFEVYVYVCVCVSVLCVYI